MDKNLDNTDWYKYWQDGGYFKADEQSDKPTYSLLMPPPNLTGDPHLGHAMQHVILDALARFKRLQGYDVLLLPGVDHAGIQFEGTFNKRLSKEGLTKEKLGREEWLKKAWEFKEEVYQAFHSTWSLMGVSADWSKEVFTLEPKVSKAVFEQFKRFWEQDLLYKGAYIVQWCPKCGTAIEDVEMEYESKTEKLYYIKYQLVDSSGTFITVATARPETISADVAIAIYPNHPQYQQLLGKMVINPFTNTHIPIIEDQRIDKEFGTGALKVTPGHDLLDYQIGLLNNLPILHSVNKEGRITDLDPNLKGLKINEARQKAAEILSESGLIEKAEDYTHSVPVCERCKTTVEPLISEEWFVKMTPLSKKALTKIDQIKFIPQSYQKILTDWMENIHDWSISRSLWWGHRIPVWYCQSCNPHHLVGNDKAMTISFEKPDTNCPSCSSSDWIQDDQVLDTWFSSGLWPLSTLDWPSSSKLFDRYFPYDFEITSPEIRYLWIARMIILSLWHTDQIPFKNMFFHGTLRDLQGRKMSKSLGNGVDPRELINQWGVDATRMTLYTYTAPGRDGRTNRQVMDQRSKNFRNFATKLRNITRFIIELKPEELKASNHLILNQINHPDDLEIIKKLQETTTIVTTNLETFNLHLATETLYNFIWHEFADIYIEKSKQRRTKSQPVLEYLLKNLLILLHPFMPFVTEEIYQKLPDHKKTIMLEKWPSQI